MKPEDIAASLSEAQKRYLSDQAFMRRPAPCLEARLMTFPPRNTHRVLIERGLVHHTGEILPLGLVVRSHLLKERGE